MIAVIVGAATVLPAGIASSQDPFGGFFSGFGRAPAFRPPPAFGPPPLFGLPPQGVPRQALPPHMHSYADPQSQPHRERRAARHATAGGGGAGAAYCVRLCDGRYFPVRRSGDTTASELCNSFCPATKTKVFNGSVIDHAVASDGTRYASLKNAFVYRDRIVADCTCNGKDAFGLARVDVADDPTLRPGDILASREGMLAYTGSSRSRNGETAHFTPIGSYSKISSDVRRKLFQTKVAPPPQRHEKPTVSAPDKKPNANEIDEDLRAQLSR